MSAPDEARQELRKLASKASQAKMDLHDLAEDLPVNWQAILTVAQRAYDAYAALESRRIEGGQP